MFKILKFVLLVLIFSGCRREYARFQNTMTESHSRPQKTGLKSGVPMPVQHKEDIPDLIEALPMPNYQNYSTETGLTVPFAEQVHEHDPTDLFPKGWFKKKNKQVPEKKKSGLFQKQDKKAVFQKKKPKKKRDGLSHRSEVRLKIGAVLLGIAIIFALLHINVLAIIFGILSAWMIIRGLRKLF